MNDPSLSQRIGNKTQSGLLYLFGFLITLSMLVDNEYFGIESLHNYSKWIPVFGAVVMAWILYRHKRAKFIWIIGAAVITYLVLKFTL